MATRSDLERFVARSRTRETELRELASTLRAQIESLDEARSRAAQEISRLDGLASIESMSRWLAQATLSSQPLISVILPTRRRPERLARAVASVRDQRYQNWELLVVDDGGENDSRVLVESTGDDRIRWSQSPSRGVCAARNAALRDAAGELIAYLDDDNTMDPQWLYAVAWAFEQRPEVDVLYGACVVDDVKRAAGEPGSALPRTFLNRWSREGLRNDNVADMGAIAHRAGLDGAWFDESLRQMGDWDLLVRLTRERDPLVLPAIACYYATDAPDRLSNGPTRAADAATVRERAAAAQAMSERTRAIGTE
jgi:glycosyltransferase involved in cell wall biosynthesis